MEARNSSTTMQSGELIRLEGRASHRVTIGDRRLPFKAIV